jgi:uncharacterized protein (UPF0332 family)
MDKIKWCLDVKNGIELVEPSTELADAYIIKSRDSMIALNELSNNEWKISAAYYAIYFSVYAVMMRIGIRCEIHDCSIEFMKQFLREYYSEEELALIEAAKNARMRAQYYADKDIDKYIYILDDVSAFQEKSFSIAENLVKADISRIRSAVLLFRSLRV